MKFKSNVLSGLPVFPSVEVLAVVWGHALGCFCHSYGRFLGIILLPAAYHALLRARGCSSCSAGIIVSPGFPFPARAGGSRRSHIPSSPHQRHGPEGWEQRLPAPNPPKKQLFQGFKGTQPRGQHCSGVLLLGLGCAGPAGSAPRGDVAAGVGCSRWAAEQMWCFALFPQVLHPAFPCQPHGC